MSAELEEIELDAANQVSHAVECARSVVLRAVAVLRSLSVSFHPFVSSCSRDLLFLMGVFTDEAYPRRLFALSVRFTSQSHDRYDY